jgi:PhnB protein
MSVSPIPTGYHSVTPYLIVRGAIQAIEFYKAAFGAVELFRLEMGNGVLGHAEIMIGDSHVMLADEFPDMGALGPESIGGTPVSLLIYMPEVDQVFARALAAGATQKKPVQNQFYGDRSGMLTDPFGHTWSIATHIEDVSPEEMTRRMAEYAKLNPEG